MPYSVTKKSVKEVRYLNKDFTSFKDNLIEFSGEFLSNDSVIPYVTSSLYRGSSFPTLSHINKLNPRDPDTTTYATASVTRGGTDTTFVETLQPFISSSRLSTINLEKEFFYGSLSDSISNGFGATYGIPGDLYVISSSLKQSEFESSGDDSFSERLFYKGTQLNKNNDQSGEEPVQIIFTSATKLVTQTPGESRLKTE